MMDLTHFHVRRVRLRTTHEEIDLAVLTLLKYAKGLQI